MGSALFVAMIAFVIYPIVTDLRRPPHRSHGIKARSRERRRRLRMELRLNKLDRELKAIDRVRGSDE